MHSFNVVGVKHMGESRYFRATRFCRRREQDPIMRIYHTLKR